MPISESIRTCAICGADISHKSARATTCSRQCNLIEESKIRVAKRKSAFEKLAKFENNCHVCGSRFKAFSTLKMYCSAKCKDAAQKQKKQLKHDLLVYTGTTKTCKTCATEKPLSDFYASNRECKRCQADKARIRMLHKLHTDSAFKERQAASNRRYELENPEKILAKQLQSKLKRRRHNAHVIAWRNWRKAQCTKHNHHVRDFVAFKKAAPNGWMARYYKGIGKPWMNPRLSQSVQYKIRYRLDLAFKLGEINRATWRKDVLAARDDGTQNFWLLLNERKTCPYCLTPITKENAVADHLDPIKLGGANSQHNLTICCRECNRRKSGKPYLAWVATLPAPRQGPALLWYKRKHGHGPEQASLCFSF